MPSANSFAECHISDTRQRHPLLSASPQTLGKESTLGKDGFAECLFLALDKLLIFFSFEPQIFFDLHIQHVVPHSQVWCIFEFICYI